MRNKITQLQDTWYASLFAVCNESVNGDSGSDNGSDNGMDNGSDNGLDNGSESGSESESVNIYALPLLLVTMLMAAFSI